MMNVEEFRKCTGHTLDKHSNEEVQRIINYFYGVCNFFLKKDMKEMKEIIEKIQNEDGSKVENPKS